MTGIDRLRAAVKLFNQCSEDFNDCFTLEELVRLSIAHRHCGWDFYPDQWTSEQIKAVLAIGELPDWNDDLTPKVPKAFEKGGVLYEESDTEAGPDEAEEPGERD